MMNTQTHPERAGFRTYHDPHIRLSRAVHPQQSRRAHASLRGMFVFDLSHDRMASDPLTLLSDVQQALILEDPRNTEAARKIGAREYDEFENHVLIGEIEPTTLPRQLDAVERAMPEPALCRIERRRPRPLHQPAAGSSIVTVFILSPRRIASTTL